MPPALPRLFLAPMAGITDSPFRALMRACGCGVVTSELVSARAILENNHRTRWMVHFEEEERPVGIQIFGEDPDVLVEAARLVGEGRPDFIDLNLGCPVKKVVKRGAGAAMLKEPGRLGRLLERLVRAVDVPITIKVRTGWDEQSINVRETVKLAADSGVARVSIHGRTRAQGYNGRADWDLIGEAKAISPIPVIGNGDLVTAEMAVARWRQSGCDGIMIGRGALKNPWIFREIAALLGLPSPIGAPPGFPALIQTHLAFIRRRPATRHAMTQFRKLLGWYSAGYPGSAAFRASVFQIPTMEELLERTAAFFAEAQRHPRQIRWDEPFLMGGHG